MEGWWSGGGWDCQPEAVVEGRWSGDGWDRQAGTDADSAGEQLRIGISVRPGK